MTRPEGSAVLELSGVSAGYGGRPVLEHVDLSVRSGEFCGVAGPNGGGKSTLLKVALGFVTPSAGTVRVLGRPPGRARGLFGYLPQVDDHDAAFPVTVRDVVSMGLLSPRPRDWLPGGRKRRRATIGDAIADADLSGLEDRRLGELSGGQRERVLLARALVSGPALLLLDEPTTGLDPGAVSALHDRLVALRDLGEVTALVVSHDLGELHELCSRVVHVDGALEERSRPPEPSRG